VQEGVVDGTKKGASARANERKGNAQKAKGITKEQYAAFIKGNRKSSANNTGRPGPVESMPAGTGTGTGTGTVAKLVVMPASAKPCGLLDGHPGPCGKKRCMTPKCGRFKLHLGVCGGGDIDAATDDAKGGGGRASRRDKGGSSKRGADNTISAPLDGPKKAK
jgi:hypothetical protein